MIKSVKGLRVGDVFSFEGQNLIVRAFPTRYSVFARSQDINSNPSIVNIRLSLNAPTLFWKHYKTGEYIGR